MSRHLIFSLDIWQYMIDNKLVSWTSEHLHFCYKTGESLGQYMGCDCYVTNWSRIINSIK